MFHTTYPYGHDLGNSETTGYTQVRGSEQVLTLSSALYRGSYEELMRLVGATSTHDGTVSILNARSHAIRFRDQSNEEREVFVGELAIKQAGNMTIDQLTGRGQVQRYWDYRSLGLLLATSGTLISDQEYGLSVVTNIPVATHTKSNTDRVRAALEGVHHFTLDGRERIAHVAVRQNIASVSNAGTNNADVERLVCHTLREVGQDIVSRIRGTWNLSFRSGAIAGDAQVIIAIGGGAYYFREELAALFTKRLQIPQAPEKVNGQGCFQLARLIVQRDTAVTKVVS